MGLPPAGTESQGLPVNQSLVQCGRVVRSSGSGAKPPGTSLSLSFPSVNGG